MRASLASGRHAAKVCTAMLLVACSDSTGPARACTAATVTNTIQLEQTLSASHAAYDCLLIQGRVADGWRLTITTPTVVVLEVPGPLIRGISLSDVNMKWLPGLGPDLVGSYVRVPLDPGEYFVWVAAGPYSGLGDYQLSARYLVTPPCGTPVGIVAIGQSVSGDIDADDCIFLYGDRADIWQLNLAAATVLGLRLTNDRLSPTVVLVNSTGRWLDFAENPHVAGHALLDITVPAGEYFILATALRQGFDATGHYTLTVQEGSASSP